MLAQAPGGDAGQAVQLAERRRREQMPVADDLVDDVRLGCVQRDRGVANVLRRVKDAIGQRAVELHRARRGRRPARSAIRSAGATRSADLVEIRDVVGGERHALQRLAVLGHRVALVLAARAHGRRFATPPAPRRCRRSRATARRAARRAPRPRSRCAARGRPDRWRPGWSCARWTVTEPSASVRHGRVELSLLEHPSRSSSALGPLGLQV